MSRLHDGVDEAADATRDNDARTQQQAKMLLAQAQAAGVTFVHDGSDVPYALIREQDKTGSQVFQIRSRRFRAFLAHLFHRRSGKTPSHTVITDAITVMEGSALFDGDEVQIYLRYRADDQSIDIDLGDSDYEMIHVTAQGWELVPHGDIYFRRPAAMLPLPKPSCDRRTLDQLRPFVHADDENFLRVLIWAVCAMRGRGPFPILPLHGEQGSAKTTTAKILKALIDPSKLDARAPCRDNHDLAVAADSSYVLVFDNLSGVSPAMADAFCRLSTGGCFTTRTLYSDRDEEIFEGQRPQIFTSIEDLLTRPDLADRTIPATLMPMPDEDRKPEDQVWTEFLRLRPQLLGALLDALAFALANLTKVRELTKKLPRMADAYLFSIAAESALQPSQDGPSVESVWQRTREEAVASALESSALAAPFLRLLERFVPNPGETWEATASEALRHLNEYAPDELRAQRAWPANGKSLMNKLRRIAPALRMKSYTFGPTPRSGKARIYHFDHLAES